MRRGKEARVLPSRLQCFKRLRFIARCNDYFKESLACRHRFGGGYVHGAAERNDAAKCSHRITAPCVLECRKHRISDRCTTRVGVLDHRTGSAVGALRMQVLHQFQCCCGVQQIVVRKQLAMQELRAHHAWPSKRAIRVHRAALVRIFTVTKFVSEFEPNIRLARKDRRSVCVGGCICCLCMRKARSTHPARDRSVVFSGACKDCLRTCAAQCHSGGAGVRAHLGDDAWVLPAVSHHRHALEVLCSTSQHRWPANINILDGLMLRNAGLVNRRFEWIQIDADKIDRHDAVRGQGRHVFWIVAHAEQSAVHFGVQGLDAPVHHLWKSSDAFDGQYGNARLGKRRGSAASGNDFNAHRSQFTREFHEP